MPLQEAREAIRAAAVAHGMTAAKHWSVSDMRHRIVGGMIVGTIPGARLGPQKGPQGSSLTFPPLHSVQRQAASREKESEEEEQDPASDVAKNKNKRKRRSTPLDDPEVIKALLATLQAAREKEKKDPSSGGDDDDDDNDEESASLSSSVATVADPVPDEESPPPPPKRARTEPAADERYAVGQLKSARATIVLYGQRGNAAYSQPINPQGTLRMQWHASEGGFRLFNTGRVPVSINGQHVAASTEFGQPVWLFAGDYFTMNGGAIMRLDVWPEAAAQQ